MSVALQIPARGDSPPRLIPIATEATYASEWLPVANSLGAAWLQRFQVGAAVDHEDIDEVAREFSMAGQHFAAKGRPHLAAWAAAVVAALHGMASSNYSNLQFYIA